MMNENGIKPIETIYQGCRFRSRLEARWAVFFDYLGIAWEYETEGFDLDGVWYLPDFWLPDLKLWVEVKAEPDSAMLQASCYKGVYQDVQEKCDALARLTGDSAILVWGVPKLTADEWLTVPNHSYITAGGYYGFGKPELFESKAFINFVVCEEGHMQVASKHHELCHGYKDFSIMTSNGDDYCKDAHCQVCLTRDLQSDAHSFILGLGSPTYFGTFYIGEGEYCDLLEEYDYLVSEDVTELHEARLAARQARFEHGSNGTSTVLGRW